MPRKRRRRKKKSGPSYTRRAALLLMVGGSTAGLIYETEAFSFIEANRTSTTNVEADQGSPLVELVGFDSSKIYQEPHRVTVTNNTGAKFNTNSATTTGDLELRDVGASTSKTSYSIPPLDAGESYSFEVVTASDKTGKISDTVSLSFSGNGVSITADRDLTVEFKSGSQLAYAVDSASMKGDIRVYDAVNDIVQDPPQNVRADVIGANAADIIDDSSADIPYINKNNTPVYTTSVGGDTANTINKGKQPKLKKQKTRIALRSWDPASLSGDLILSADNNSSSIIAVDSTGNTEVIAVPPNGCGGVAGVADIDDDGNDEMVFVDASQQIRYLEQSGSTKKVSNGGVGSNNSTGFGAPADFDGDNVPEIPFIDGSNNPAIVTASGTKTLLNSSSIAKKAAIAPVDIDGDGELEFAFLSSSSGKIKYIDDVTGSNTVKTLMINGSPVTPLEKIGLNTIHDPQDF